MLKILAVFALLLTMLTTVACPVPTSPDAEKKVMEQAAVPGLEEGLKAKDMAIKAAIQISWKSDVELIQEQLAVEEVHHGKVRITGIVSRPELKERAERIAKSQEGVSDVSSTITVDEKLKDKRISLDGF
jgi:osmotically-inducible protein OsmY